MNLRFQACVVSSLVAAAASMAQPSRAQGLVPHPAVLVHATPSGIDPSTVIVGHPASPKWAPVAAPLHANAEHPAVLMARRAVAPHIDVNTFLVQPPATTTWTLGPQVDDAPQRLALTTVPRW